MIALIDSDTPLPDHYIDNLGYVLIRGSRDTVGIHLHRYIVEQAIGRKLRTKEIVHHINYNKLDNRRCNLLLCPDQAYHKLIHARTDAINSGVNLETQHKCSSCKEVKMKSDFPKNKGEWNGVNHDCKLCSNNRRREKQYSKGKFDWLQRLKQQYNRVKRGYTKRDICWITKEVKVHE